MESASPSRDPFALPGVGAFGVAAGYAGILATMLVRHQWILDGKGHPIVGDFLAPFTAGHMAIEGHAVAAYNPLIHHAAEEAIVGHAFPGGLAWPYPPHFFFITTLLALLPYAVAFLLWAVATLALYAGVLWAIASDRRAVLLALVPPFVLGGMLAGQSGFFSAALIGGALLALERRPIVAGILFGLLSFKPQFGILVPFALAASGQWRAFATAAGSCVLLFLLAAGVFGFGTVPAFLQALPATTSSLLVHGQVGWNKIQSIYGASRWLGGSDGLAAGLQIVVSLSCCAIIVLVWRSDATPALKSAVLAAAVPLATPYVFVYDFPFVAVALAFLYRAAPLDRVETWASIAALVPLVVFAFLPTPVALLTPLLILAMIIRRLLKGASGRLATGLSLTSPAIP